jgi:general secretion pathway protein G
MKLTTPKRNQLKQARRSAFTLVELLLVLAILAILAGIVLPRMSGRTQQAKIARAQTEISTFSTALGAYNVDTGDFPKGKNGLLFLVQKPNGVQGWRGPYLENQTTVPLDPWNNPYIYECPGKHNPTGFDILSMGPDGRVGGDDDICNWQNK